MRIQKDVISLFDGGSCGQVALNKMGLKFGRYYASEIDKYAIQVTMDNWPDTIQLGDILNWREWDIDWANVGLIMGGSPCQGFSFAGKQLAFDDPRSKLFFVFVDILEHVRKFNPDVKFLLENVRMKKDYLDVIDAHLETAGVLVNSRLVSAHDRKRYYWTNVGSISQPEDKGVLTNSIIDYSNNTPNKEGWQKWWKINSEFQLKKKYSIILNDTDKSITQTARQMSSWNGNLVRCNNGQLRFASTIECERLQCLPDKYTSSVSNSQAYKILGNGWNVDTIVHVLLGLL